MDSFELVQCLVLCLPVAVKLCAVVNELLDFLLVFDGEERAGLELLHLLLLQISNPVLDQLDLDVFHY